MNSSFWKSRLPGPFLLSFLLCFALIDYIIYSQTNDSPLGLVWKFIALLSYIFDSLPISSYFSAMTLFLLGSVVLFLVVVVASKDNATKAMQDVTEKVVVEDRLLEIERSSVEAEEESQAPRASAEVNEAPDQAERRWGFPALSLRFLPQWKFPDLGVTAKMVVSFAAIATLFGLGTIAIVYYLSFGVFETQISKRADVMAMNLGEAVAKQVLEKNLVGLRREILKYAGREDVAYIFVEDDAGNILSRSVKELPAQNPGSLLQPASKFIQWVPIRYRGYPVYETHAGIQDGKLGILHLGIWKSAVETEIYRIFWAIALSILVATIIGVMIFSLAVRGISRPLLQLAQSANRISEGELDRATGAIGRDEVGKLAIAIERIRASLMAATKRLDPAPSSRSKPTAEHAQLSSHNPVRLS